MSQHLIRPTDDLLHRPDDNPDWNESAWFSWHVPERMICGWVYLYHRPNMRYTVAGAAAWDPSGEHQWNCLFYDFGDAMPLATDGEMFDFQALNSFSGRCIEPLTQFRFGYNAEGCELDMSWTAATEPFATGFPQEMQHFGGPTHFEQVGRMTGTVTLASLGGETLDIDCWSLRDRSWGPRRITASLPRGDNPWALASDRHGFFLSVLGEDPANDPVDGTVERILRGWYIRDGQKADIFTGTRRVTERGPDGRPQLVVVDGNDELGRKFHAEGHPVNWLHWLGYPHFFQWWSLARWEFDGIAAYGQVTEWMPLDCLRRYVRSHNPTVSAASSLQQA